MGRPQLYLLVGYPGSGKTTISKIIHDMTGAVHIWSDWERRTMFRQPTHSAAENHKLYDYLNTMAAQLISDGKSVIFDTNFNFFRDRENLRKIATKAGADTTIIWLTTPIELSKKRAVQSGMIRNGYNETMTAEQFDRIASHLESPGKNEKVIKISGIRLDAERVKRLLGLE
jgi:predicted kinase